MLDLTANGERESRLGGRLVHNLLLTFEFSSRAGTVQGCSYVRNTLPSRKDQTQVLRSVEKKLNTPKAVVVVLALLLVINGLLFYRYELTKTSAATTPSLEGASLVAEKSEGDGSTGQEEERGTQETVDAAESYDGEVNDGPEAQQTDSEASSAPNPYPPPASEAPPAGSPTPATAEDPTLASVPGLELEQPELPYEEEPAYELPYEEETAYE